MRPSTTQAAAHRAPVRAAAVAALLAVPAAAPGQTAFDFAAPVVYELPVEVYPNSVDAGDLDGDGRADLVLAGRNNDGFAVVMFSGADGVFEPPVLLEIGDQTNWAVVRDLDGDLDMDVAITHRQGLGRVSFLAGDGAGGLAAAVDTPAGRTPTLVRALDLDSDLDLDLAVFNWGSFDVSILRNDGGGAFALARTIGLNRTASPQASPVWADAADLDGDGDVDLAVVSITALGFMSLIFNRGDGTFDPPVQKTVAGLIDDDVIATVTAADFDGDGDVDLITKAGGFDFLDRLIVLANDGAGNFTTADQVPLSPAQGGSPWDVVAADFDGDRTPDLAWVTHFLSTQSAVFLRNQRGAPPDFAFPEQRVFLDGFPRALVPSDIDADGDLDLVVANIGSHTVAVFENLRIAGASAGTGAGPAPGLQRAAMPRSPGPGDLYRLAAYGAPTRGAPARARPRAAVPVSGGKPSCGGPDAGDCFEPHESPGCADEACCTLVCKADPFCCREAWDQSCADAAEQLCEPPPVCPAKGQSCFEPNREPGCEDVACCELVCLVDPFCCDGPWDRLCADQAAQFCSAPACALTRCPAGATVEPEGNECLDQVNDGCNMAEPAFTPISCGEAVCGSAWTLSKRDTDWYAITVEEPAELTWTVNAEFPCEIMIVTGTCDDTYTVAASAFGGGCQSASAHLGAPPGTYYLFVAPGTDVASVSRGIGCVSEGKLIEGGAFGGRYFATVTCQGGCPADLDGDARVGVTDLLVMLAAWGTGPDGPPDLNGDGAVGAADLAALLASWGPCP